MKHFSVILLGVFLLVCWPPDRARSEPAPVSMAKVSHLEGKASYSADEGKSFKSLSLGYQLPAGVLVKTEKDSRMELELPDGSFIRLAAGSQIKVDFLEHDPKTDDRNFRFRMGLGKLWAKARDVARKGSSFEVETANAVTGVRGTVFRINVDPNQATIVKVYQGSILLRSPREVFRPPAGGREKRQEIAGPREVAPPQEISRAEWELLVKDMQEVYISPDGKASRPRSFTLKEDLDDWVKWNLERDKAGFPSSLPPGRS